MSKEKLEDKLNETAGSLSVDAGVTPQETELAVFYRCTCPKCGGHDLELCRFGDFVRSWPVCIDEEEDIGCYEVELDGNCFDYHLECADCGHTLSGGWSDFTGPLLEGARSRNEKLETLSFICPSCKSRSLNQITAGARIFHSVVAVYTTTEEDDEESEPVVAISPHVTICPFGPVRYECLKGHELVKDDGTPVETDEELVEWLKTHQASNNE